MTSITQIRIISRIEARLLGRSLLFCVAVFFSTLLLSSCGGVSHGMSKPTVTILAMTGDTVLSDTKVRLAISQEGGPFLQEQSISTDATGLASATFKSRWTAAFFIIPPIGNIPQRPPRPQYVASWRDHEAKITRETPGAVYIWKRGSWSTKATISFPQQ